MLIISYRRIYMGLFLQGALFVTDFCHYSRFVSSIYGFSGFYALNDLRKQVFFLHLSCFNLYMQILVS